MARSKSDHQTGRLFRKASGQDELFEKSYEEELEAGRDQPVECLGLAFENDEARRTHFLGKLKGGLEELHKKLGGIPFTSVDDAVSRMMAIETWPMGNEARLRELAKSMRHANSSKICCSAEGRVWFSPWRDRGYSQSVGSALLYRVPEPISSKFRCSCRQALRPNR